MDPELLAKFHLLVGLHQTYVNAGSFSNWGEKEKEAIRNNFTYHSTKIEGLTLTYGQTIKFLKDNIVRTGMKMKDVYDLKNHRDVLNKIFSAFEETSLSEQTIKSLHGELMKDDAQWEVQDALLAPAGHYKTEDNFTLRPNGQYHMYLEYQKVQGAVRTLVEETRQQLNEGQAWEAEQDYFKHPLSIIADFHYSFLQIHPFSDGNGRLTRLLTTLLLLKHQLPPIIIRDEERGVYFQALIDSENDSRRTPIIEFFVDKAIDLMKQRIALAEHRDTSAPDFHEPSV
jgi:Fic family protein